jgi:SAM-dependent methyltransferase
VSVLRRLLRRRPPDKDVRSDDSSNCARTSRYWDERIQAKAEPGYRIRSWSESEFVLAEYIHPAISGLPDSNWLTWTADTFVAERPLQRILDLGCGVGGIERHGCSLNLAERFDAYDASAGSIDEARRHATAAGLDDKVRYKVADFALLDLPPDTYDLVFMDNSLHHCFDVAGMLEKIETSLRSGGLLVLNEFVGPDRFQWTATQLEAINAALECLPARCRTQTDGTIRVAVERPSLELMIALDPSEAVQAERIVPEVMLRFAIEARRDWGGTVLHPLLQDIIQNFNTSDEEDAALLKFLFLYERTLLESQKLTSDFTLLVARKS